MKDETLLLVDLSNQVYKATAAHQGLTSGQTFTGGLYGFITAIAYAVEDTLASRIILCRDSKPYHRSIEYPDYKGDRNEKERSETDELLLRAYQQSMRLVTDLAHELGLPIFAVAGFEADDLIAFIARKWRHRFEQIVALSNDSDLHQLLHIPNFYQHRGKRGSYTRKEFDLEWGGIEPAELVDALALTGTHNAVEGIFKVGPKTAIKALKDPKRWDDLYKKHGPMIERNRRLITLPHPDFDWSTELPERITCRSPGRVLTRFCGRYDIQVTRVMDSSFEQLLT